MVQTKSHPEYVLSIILAFLMALQSAGGLVISGLYRDNTWVTSGWRGNDLVTLVVAVPILVAALIFSMRGSMRAQLVWLGMLYYALYNNMFYLFGSTFNWFFLIYVALFALSAFSLIFGLSKVDINRITEGFKAKTPIKWISGFMFLFAAILGVMWIGQCFLYVVTGQIPEIVVDAGGFTHLVAALDLSMIAPPLVLGAIWLWKSRPWGYVVTAVLLVQCAVYTVVLIALAPFQAGAGVQGAWDMVPLWTFIGVGCLTSSGLLLRNKQSGISKELK